MTEADENEELAAELRSALKGGTIDEAPPDVLAGFQKKVRERSGVPYLATVCRQAKASTCSRIASASQVR